MGDEAIARMLWAVAARYGFTAAEVLGLPLRELRFWYEGHEYMVGEERRQVGGAIG